MESAVVSPHRQELHIRCYLCTDTCATSNIQTGKVVYLSAYLQCGFAIIHQQIFHSYTKQGFGSLFGSVFKLPENAYQLFALHFIFHLMGK